MMKRKTMGAVALVPTLMLLTACAYGSSDGHNTAPTTAPSAQAPGPGASPSDCAYNTFDDACFGSPSPNTVIDAVPQAPEEPSPHIAFSGSCRLDLQPENIGLVAGGGIVAVHAYSSCKTPLPWDVTITTVIQKCERAVCGDADWRSIPTSLQADGRIPPPAPLFNLVGWHTDCVPDVSYRVAARASGHSAVYHDKVETEGAPFAVPPLDANGRPTYAYGAAITFSSTTCG